MDFTVPVGYRVQIKEKENKNDLDLAWELKKLWNMKVKVMQIIVGEFGTLPNNLEKGREKTEIRGRIKPPIAEIS